MVRTIRLAHSPDPDDAFMAAALAAGRLDDERLRFDVTTADVETLNRAALDERYDVTALSAAALPSVATRFVVLHHGASFGEGYGPVVVARAPLPPAEARNARIAIPGARTTAYLALRLAWGAVDTVEVPFERIPDAVRTGAADAGLLIHEGQITFARLGLAKILDLGEWWRAETGGPLPLGVVAARRALGADLAEVSRRVRASTEWALANRAAALAHARPYGRGIPDDDVDRFVAMYVNERTRDMGDAGRRAIRELLRRASDAGYAPRAEVTFHA